MNLLSALPDPANPQQQVVLSWTQTADPYAFARYEVWRSTSPNVQRGGTNSRLVGSIFDPYATSFTDTALTPGVTYYYKVFVVEQTIGAEVVSVGSNELSVQTAHFAADPARVAPYPFVDPIDPYSLDPATTPWSPAGTWGLDQGTDRYGNPGTFWSDSPGVGVNYPQGANQALELSVDLRAAQHPVLSFWHRYDFAQGDVGLLYVSPDQGATWYELMRVRNPNGVMSSAGLWEPVRVDLSPFAGRVVRIQFITRDANNDGVQRDGWQIDDVQITERAVAGTFAYPLRFGFDTYTELVQNWITGNDLVQAHHILTDGYGNLGAVQLPWSDISPSGGGAEGGSPLVLAKPVDLSQARHPIVSLWVKGSIDQLLIDASLDGHNWFALRSWANFGTGGAWQRITASLAPYAGQRTVWLRLRHRLVTSWKQMRLDDFAVEEDPTIPSSIAIASGDGQVGQAGQTLAQPLVVRVLDNNLLPLPGKRIDFTATKGVVSPYTAVTDAQGYASTFLTLDPYGGAHQVTATLAGTNQSVTFNATGYLPGTAVYLKPIAGDRQAVDIYAASQPLTVQVTDITGQPIRDVYVQFSVVGVDGQVQNPYAVPTDIYGLASNVFVAGGTTGLRTVLASAAGLVGSPVAFSLQVVLPGGTLGDTDGDGMPDDWETAHGLNPLDAADASLDPDADGLVNLAEFGHGTDPQNPDTDGDGMPDGWEVQYGLNPLDPADAFADPNGNGIPNLQEFQNGTVPVFLPHFAAPSTTSQWMDLFGAVSIAGVPAQPGTEIAVYDPQGVLCGRFIVTQAGRYGFLHVYADDPTTPQDEGATIGDTLTFEIWDPVNRVVRTATASVPPVFAPGARLQLDLNGEPGQAIHLQAGWNLISFSVKVAFHDPYALDPYGQIPEPMLPGVQYVPVQDIGYAFPELWDAYGNPLFEVIRSFDSKGAHTYDPLLPQFSDLHYIAAGYGYWIKMKQPVTILVRGVRAKPGDTLALHSGWNLVGYWHNTVRYTGNQAPMVPFPPDVSGYQQVTDIGAILSAIVGQYDLVRSYDQNGAHTYDPTLTGQGFNDMSYMGPGYGYWIHMTQPGQLSYR